MPPTNHVVGVAMVGVALFHLEGCGSGLDDVSDSDGVESDRRQLQTLSVRAAEAAAAAFECAAAEVVTGVTGSSCGGQFEHGYTCPYGAIRQGWAEFPTAKGLTAAKEECATACNAEDTCKFAGLWYSSTVGARCDLYDDNCGDYSNHNQGLPDMQFWHLYQKGTHRCTSTSQTTIDVLDELTGDLDQPATNETLVAVSILNNVDPHMLYYLNDSSTLPRRLTGLTDLEIRQRFKNFNRGVRELYAIANGNVPLEQVKVDFKDPDDLKSEYPTTLQAQKVVMEARIIAEDGQSNVATSVPESKAIEDLANTVGYQISETMRRLTATAAQTEEIGITCNPVAKVYAVNETVAVLVNLTYVYVQVPNITKAAAEEADACANSPTPMPASLCVAGFEHGFTCPYGAIREGWAEFPTSRGLPEAKQDCSAACDAESTCKYAGLWYSSTVGARCDLYDENCGDYSNHNQGDMQFWHLYHKGTCSNALPTLKSVLDELTPDLDQPATNETLVAVSILNNVDPHMLYYLDDSSTLPRRLTGLTDWEIRQRFKNFNRGVRELYAIANGNVPLEQVKVNFTDPDNLKSEYPTTLQAQTVVMEARIIAEDGQSNVATSVPESKKIEDLANEVGYQISETMRRLTATASQANEVSVTCNPVGKVYAVNETVAVAVDLIYRPVDLSMITSASTTTAPTAAATAPTATAADPNATATTACASLFEPDVTCPYGAIREGWYEFPTTRGFTAAKEHCASACDAEDACQYAGLWYSSTVGARCDLYNENCGDYTNNKGFDWHLYTKGNCQ